MIKKNFTGQDLLNGVNEGASQEVHLEGAGHRRSRRLSGSWDEYFDSEGCSDDFLENRDQPAKQRD